MSKINQVVAQPFGTSASAGQIGVFGSKAANSPATTTDPTTMQSLGAWASGWFSAVIDGNSPCIQDMNAFCFVVMYMFTYLQEMGISEWNAAVTYYTGSIVNIAGILYVSLVDSNTNNAPATHPTQWALWNPSGSSVTAPTAAADYTILSTDKYVRMNNTGGVVYHANLPAASGLPIGWTVTIKNVSTDGTNLLVVPSGSDTFDGVNASISLYSTPSLASIQLRVVSSSAWDII